ncbi:hypothetical protein JTE90_027043 [Oedothorax gibbosus]|uniref:Uncharacterized protein n=1 Tax=Oedothorax gibbosus TaxID=931172 RepID=A0AAV6UV45_9ARAC|nr:hypothetical protein JTE90_027043 [Oedothorax gibbosus]
MTAPPLVDPDLLFFCNLSTLLLDTEWQRRLSRRFSKDGEDSFCWDNKDLPIGQKASASGKNRKCFLDADLDALLQRRKEALSQNGVREKGCRAEKVANVAKY